MISSLVFASILAGGAQPAQTAQPSQLKFQIVGAGVFENGYALVAREADVPKSGDYVMMDLPSPSMGTLLITSTPGTTIESVVRGSQFIDDKSSVGDINDLLSHNVGKTVTLSLQNLPSASGKLVGVFDQFVLLDSGGHQRAILKNSINGLESSEALQTVVPGRHLQPVLRFKIRAGEKARVRLVDMERGLSWIPSYTVDISDKNELTLTQRATISNDLGLINNRLVKLTTGFPNLPYAGTIDPLFAQSVTKVFFGTQPGSRAGGLIPPGIDYFNYDPNDNSIVVRGTQEDANQQMPTAASSTFLNEDMYSYDLPGITLDKGERGFYVIQQEKCPYEHLYTWNVSGGQQQIWHSIQFTNGKNGPLTAGSGTTFKDGDILGQGLLDYTAAGGKGILTIAQALDIVGDFDEEEASRQREALKVGKNDSYDLVIIKGTLVVHNNKNEAVNVKVTKDLVGEITELPKGATATKYAQGLRDVNPRTRLEWTPKVEAGGRATLIYTYKYYSHS